MVVAVGLSKQAADTHTPHTSNKALLLFVVGQDGSSRLHTVSVFSRKLAVWFQFFIQHPFSAVSGMTALATVAH